MLKAGNKRLYHPPRTLVEDYSTTVDDDSYHHELWEEIPGLYNNRMTDEEFEIFARLDGRVKLEAHGPSDELYMLPSSSELDQTARYFNDEDLFGRLDDEYDYPLGVDDEYDSYIRDIYQDDLWIGLDGEDCSEGSDQNTILEEALVNARLFHGNDLCDRGDLRDSADSKQAEEPKIKEAGPPQMEDVVDEDLFVVVRMESPSLPIKEKSSKQGEYEQWRSTSCVRPLIVSRARARSN